MIIILPSLTSSPWRRAASTLWERCGSVMLVLSGGCLLSLPGAEPPAAVPPATVADWQKDPNAALAQVVAQLNVLTKAYQDLQSTASWMAWGAGTLLAVLGVARMLPGPARAVANVAWALLAPKLEKVAEDKRDVMAKGFLEVAAIMRSFPKDSKLGDVVDKLNSHLPEPVKQAYREWENTQSAIRPPTADERVAQITELSKLLKPQA